MFLPLRSFLLVIILGIGISASVFAQPDTTAYKAGWRTLNYSVPESPAFKILGVTPDNILRPTTTRDIAIAIGNYYLNNGATIPKNISVEFSPRIFSKDSVVNYNSASNRMWNTSAFSIGTLAASNGAYSISMGYKVKLIDDADMRSNKNYYNYISSVGSAFPNVLEAAVAEVATETGRPVFVVADAFANQKNPQNQTLSDSVKDAYVKNADPYVKKFLSFRDDIKNSLWNATVWDLGVAVLVGSSDSLIKHLSAPSIIGLWSTYACPIFGKNGQLLIGLNGQLVDDSTKSLKIINANLGLRGYYGSNDLKGFLEMEFKAPNNFDSKLISETISLGIETTVLGGMWVDARIGIAWIGSAAPTFAPTLNLYFATPEK